MTVLKRGNSRFWYAQFQIGGRTVVRSTKTTDKRIAREVESKFRAQIHAEEFLGQKASLTFEAAIDQLIQTKRNTPNQRNLLANRKAVLAAIRGSKPLETVSSKDVEEFRQKRAVAGFAPQTIQHGINLIRATVKCAKRLGYTVPDISFPSEKIGKGRTRYLSPEEEVRLLAELDPRRESRGLARFEQRSPKMVAAMQDCYDLAVILLDTGGRYSEIANLTWQQIDLEGRIIRLWRPKVQNESVLFMTDRVLAILERRGSLRRAGAVFTNKKGSVRGYSAQSIRKAFNRAGLHDCTIHCLRHTHATRLIQNGLSLYEVRAVLGHSDIKTTMRYAHLEQTSVTMKARDVINALNGLRETL